MSDWKKAGKRIARFTEGVLSGVDGEGRPWSARLLTLRYDPATGRLPARLASALGAVPGPALLLCHKHDENLWNMDLVQVKGRLEREGDGWCFVSTEFEPPSTWAMIRRVGRSATAYLERRQLARPVVDFAAIDRLWAEARRLRGG